MDVREERRRWCMELAVKHARNGATEVKEAAREYELFLTELDAKPVETPKSVELPAERPARKGSAKPSGNSEQLP